MNKEEKIFEDILSRITNALKNVVGVDAIVMGGSRAIGTNVEGSNLDVAIYYTGDGVLDVDHLSSVFTELDELHRVGLLALPGTWGTWLNGGSCIKMGGYIVDVYLRNVNKVKEVIEASNKGKISVSYQFGYPFGFVSSMYLAEIDNCRILFEKRKVISQLKRSVRPLNTFYKKCAIEHFLWEADYSSKSGRRSINKKDVVYASGALFKCVCSLTQVIYTMNDEYVLNQKGALIKMKKFKKLPNNFITNVERIFIALDDTNIKNAFDLIDFYIADIKSILHSMS